MADSAREAYDRYAPVYDECNAQNDYEMWLGEVLLPELDKHGLRKGWALDVGCGTGSAFDPLLGRGWQVVGCDVSSGMLGEARRKFGSRVRLLELDARSLPPICPTGDLPTAEEFTLILLLNDVLNYIVEGEDLERVFAGVKRNLCREQGVVVFDANTLALFREDYTAGTGEEMGAEGWEWRGLIEEAKPGLVYEAQVSGAGVERHVHRQRHWTTEQVRNALESSGLTCLAALGQRELSGRVQLSDSADEERDAKIVYVASHSGVEKVHSGAPG